MKLNEFQSIYADALAKKNNTTKIHRRSMVSSVGSKVQAIIFDPEYNSEKPDVIERAIRLCRANNETKKDES